MRVLIYKPVKLLCGLFLQLSINKYLIGQFFVFTCTLFTHLQPEGPLAKILKAQTAVVQWVQLPYVLMHMTRVF